MTAPRHDDLPAYQSTRTCPKCRGARFTTEYRRQRPRLTWTGGELNEITHPGADSDGECLLRTCDNCDWAWLEACADLGTQDLGRDASP